MPNKTTEQEERRRTLADALGSLLDAEVIAIHHLTDRYVIEIRDEGLPLDFLQTWKSEA